MAFGLTQKWLSLHWEYLGMHNSNIQKEDAGSSSVFQLLSFRDRSSTSGYIFWVWIAFASLKICVLSWETSYNLFLWWDNELSFFCCLELKVGDREASCGLNSMKQLEARPYTCLELIKRYTGSTTPNQHLSTNLISFLLLLALSYPNKKPEKLGWKKEKVLELSH